MPSLLLPLPILCFHISLLCLLSPPLLLLPPLLASLVSFCHHHLPLSHLFATITLLLHPLGCCHCHQPSCIAMPFSHCHHYCCLLGWSIIGALCFFLTSHTNALVFSLFISLSSLSPFPCILSATAAGPLASQCPFLTATTIATC